MEKKNGSFSKVRKLVTVLKKCNGKAVVGDSGALISPAAARILMYCGLLAVGIALFLGAYVLEPFVGEFISPKSLAQSVMVALFITTVILAIKDTVTVLYTSDDLALLLPMPPMTLHFCCRCRLPRDRSWQQRSLSSVFFRWDSVFCS